MDNYQIIGPNLWRDCFQKLKQKMFFMENSYIYPYDCDTFSKFFNSTDDSDIKPNTIGIHWYNGSPITKKFINSNPSLKNCDPEKNVCFKYISFVQVG